MRKLKRLVERYAEACVELSWLGYRDACEHDKIRKEHEQAKAALYKALSECELQLQRR